MQASFYIIVRNSIFMNFTIRGSSVSWLRARMVRMTALDIQVSLGNPMAFVLPTWLLVKTLYTPSKILGQLHWSDKIIKLQ